jgi:CheY-like chemotaxis protein
MRILIVEDNAFNAFCLSRLLETIFKHVHIICVKNSSEALSFLQHYPITLVILDGDLGAGDGLQCNGPVLASVIWSMCHDLPVIAWTNSDNMRQAFADVFQQHGKLFDEYRCWKKMVSLDHIQQSLHYLLTPQPQSRIARTNQRYVKPVTRYATHK